MDTLASRLAHAMKLKGVKIPALVAETGMTYQGIKKILDSKTASIQYENLVLLCKFLGVRPDWLARGEEPIYPTIAHMSGTGSIGRFTAAGNMDAVVTTANATSAPTLVQALGVLADKINSVEDAAARTAIGQRLMTLASAPDSKKAMDGVLELLGHRVTGYAEKVIEMKLTKESSDVYQQGSTQDAHSKL